VADVIYGNVNPSGKLTNTWPQVVGQEPLYYNHKNTGRPLEKGKWFTKFRSNYLDVSNDPVYPFGYGLSYTTFSYSDITLSRSTLNSSGEITATVSVTNTGNMDGKEVVQMYLNDPVSTITQPVERLIGFQKIFLRRGETKPVTFRISINDLKFYNSELKWVAEPGDFNVYIGTNSQDVKAAKFTLLKR
jgi:beta-glucosidase